MEHDWKKATLKPAVAAKNSDATNLTRHLKGKGSYSLEAVWRPYTICLVKIFTWIDKVNAINNSAEIIWFFAVDNSINAYLTEKYLSEHTKIYADLKISIISIVG